MHIYKKTSSLPKSDSHQEWTPFIDILNTYIPLQNKILAISQFITNVEYRYPTKETIMRLNQSWSSNEHEEAFLPLPFQYLRIGNIYETPRLYDYLLKIGFPPNVEVNKYVVIGNGSKAA